MATAFVVRDRGGDYGGVVTSSSTAPPSSPAEQPASGVPALARTAIDRAAHRRTEPDWLAKAWQRSRVLVVWEGRALVSDAGDAGDAHAELVLLDPASAPAGDRLFLGVDADGAPYFAVIAPLPTRDGARARTVRSIGHALSARDAGLLNTAVALANWHTGSPYSPATGGATAPSDGGWVRLPATGDGPPSWPRTDPVVIVLIADGVTGDDGRCLLGRKPEWPPNRFSCLAGFVEPGESAEAAVVREVAEEVGVTVGALRYQASQPWPNPSQLMLAYSGVADPAAPLVVDETEIAEARWFTRREVRGGTASSPDLPPPSSIAYFLISRWLTG